MPERAPEYPLTPHTSFIFLLSTQSLRTQALPSTLFGTIFQCPSTATCGILLLTGSAASRTTFWHRYLQCFSRSRYPPEISPVTDKVSRLFMTHQLNSAEVRLFWDFYSNLLLGYLNRPSLPRSPWRHTYFLKCNPILYFQIERLFYDYHPSLKALHVRREHDMWVFNSSIKSSNYLPVYRTPRSRYPPSFSLSFGPARSNRSSIQYII